MNVWWGGGTLDFKWQEWSNEGKNQNLKNSLDQKLTPKNPMPNFWAIKIYYWNYVAGICRSYHESSDCFECTKKSLLKSSYQKKKIFAKILQPPKIPKLKLSLPKTPLVIPVTWNLQYPPLGVGLLFGTWNPVSLFYFLNTAKSIELACKRLSMVSLYWMIDVIHPINKFFFLLLGNVNPNYCHRASAGIFCRSHSTGQNTGHRARDNQAKLRASPSPNPYPKCYF